MSLSTVEINPTAPHTHTVIWMHGLGADGHDFESIVPELSFDTSSIHFIFPNAPIQPVTINNGMEMRSWYDILELSEEGRANCDDIYSSSSLIVDIIDKEIDKGIASKNILLAGFSQGGAMALHTAIRYPKNLAGILALSTYLPTANKIAEERNIVNNEIPIFMAHGNYDQVIPITLAKGAKAALESHNYSIQWEEYPMAHQLCYEEIKDISAFLKKVLL